jgi:hypothetical protein
VDGRKIDREVPFIGAPVMVGKHQVVISAKGEKAAPYKTIIDFTPGREVTCRFNFETRDGGCW